MKRKLFILLTLSAMLFAANSSFFSADARAAVKDEADWNKKSVTITVPKEYKNYKNTEVYTLKSVGVWQWGSKTIDGGYSVYFDASDIKKMCDLYENKLLVPKRYSANCQLHDATVAALQ